MTNKRGAAILLCLMFLPWVLMGQAFAPTQSPLTLTASSASEIPLTIKMAASPTGDPFDIASTLGVNIFAVRPGSTSAQVNGFAFRSGSTGNDPRLSAVGSDSNVNLPLIAQGTGSLLLNSTSTTAPAAYVDSNKNIVANSSTATTNGAVQLFRNGTLASQFFADTTTDTEWYGGGTNTTFTINNVGTTNFLSGDIAIATAGKGLIIKSGSNAKVGTGTLSGGTLAVSNTSVTANSYILVQDTGGGVVANIGALYIASQTAGVGFTVTSSNAIDTSTFKYFILETNGIGGWVLLIVLLDYKLRLRRRMGRG